MNKINQFTDQIVEIVKLSYDNLKLPEVRQFKKHMSDQAYREEFRTVKIRLQRQVGHTAAAVRLLNSFPNSLVFVPKGSMRHHFEQMYHNATDSPYLNPEYREMFEGEYKPHPSEKGTRDFLRDRVWCADNERLERFLLDQKYLVDNSYDLVIIDNASHYRLLEKVGLYGLLENRTKLFVELQ